MINPPWPDPHGGYFFHRARFLFIYKWADRMIRSRDWPGIPVLAGRPFALFLRIFCGQFCYARPFLAFLLYGKTSNCMGQTGWRPIFHMPN